MSASLRTGASSPTHPHGGRRRETAQKAQIEHAESSAPADDVDTKYAPRDGQTSRSAHAPAPQNSPDENEKEESATSSSNTIPNLIGGLLPLALSWGVIVSLIFGGCCSNVFALEALIKREPASGLLITFAQFVVVAAVTWPQHAHSLSRPWQLRRPQVPLTAWLPSIAMFYAVNMLNNYAFAFHISVPVHIVLRSGGSVSTMLVGFLWGKRYSRSQIIGVAMLTIGVVIAAMADAQSKGKLHAATPNSNGNTTAKVAGLSILLFAQLLSAVMGLYVQETYVRYGPHWHENLFYSHLLSLPLFLPLARPLLDQWRALLASPPLHTILPSPKSTLILGGEVTLLPTTRLQTILTQSPLAHLADIPVLVPMLLLNALAQFACIRGVNLLGARTSALGVTVVLNLRKLVSLFASLWLFGHTLPAGVILGAAIVFAGAAVYAIASRRPSPAKQSMLSQKKRS